MAAPASNPTETTSRETATKLIVMASWLLGAAFAIVQAPAVEEAAFFFSLFCACMTGVLGTLGAWAWYRGKIKLGAPSAALLIVFVSWWVSLGVATAIPRALFARLDQGLGISRAAFTSAVTMLLIQGVLVAMVWGGSRLVRALERTNAVQNAEEAVARRMHDALVPDVDLKKGAISVWGRSVPCDATGGDFIEVFEDERAVTIVVGDVSGHGVGAGILMAMVKGALRVRLRQDLPLDRLLMDINEMVLSLNRPGVFITATCVRVHESGHAQVALAGHLPIIRLDPTDPKPRDIHNQCLPLGVESEEQYVTQEFTLAPGETLALLTDGLVEVQDRAGKQIGLTLVRKVMASRLHATLPEIFQALAVRCEDFGRQLDDQTLVLLRYGQRPETLAPLPPIMDESVAPVSALEQEPQRG